MFLCRDIDGFANSYHCDQFTCCITLIFIRPALIYYVKFSIGLDINAHWVKAVALSTDKKFLQTYKIKIVNGDKSLSSTGNNTSARITAIKALIHELQLPLDCVITNFRGSYVLARTYMPPSTDKDSFEKWFVESIESIIPGIPVRDIVYSFRLMPSGRALIAFAKTEELEKYLTTCEQCDFFPFSVNASCLALYYAFTNHPMLLSKKNLAVLDIQTDGADLLIIKEGEVYSTSTISCSNNGSLTNNRTRSHFYDSLLSDLNRVLHHYEEKDQVKIEHLIIVGDSTGKKDISRRLGQDLKLTTELGNPFHHIDIKPPTKQGGFYSQALGLALTGFQQDNIDLMPAEMKEKHRKINTARQVKKVAQISLFFTLPLLLGLIGLFFLTNISNRTQAQRLNELKTEIAQLSSINQVESALGVKIEQIKTLYNSHINWSEALSRIGKAAPPGLYFDEISTDVRLLTTESNIGRQTKLTIKGCASSTKCLLEFIKNLEKNYTNIAVEKMEGDGKCEFKVHLGL